MAQMFKSSILLSLNKQLQHSSLNGILIRSYATHWDPKFKKLRKEKFVKVKFPDFEEMKNDTMFSLTAEEKRARAIKEGIEPPVSFEYKPINITTSNEIFEPYVPPEGDGKATSFFSKDYASQYLEKVSKIAAKKLRHARTVKKYDESFDESLFGENAQQIYIEAHNALMNRDNEKLLEHVTEHAYSKMWLNMKYKTIRWKWIESLEEPKVKHIVTREMLKKSNLYAQITVRMHSKQMLAVYDRFGRLAYGSDKIAKDVLEYVVFERHLSNMYGTWRMHDKIEPDWAPAKPPIIRTYIQPKPFKVDEKLPDKDVSKFKKDDQHLLPDESTSSQSKPALSG